MKIESLGHDHTVTLTVTAKWTHAEPFDAKEAAALMAAYLAGEESPFWEDYGLPQEPDDDGEFTTWGGYPGPFVVAVEVDTP